MENELFEKTKVSKAYMTLALPVTTGKHFLSDYTPIYISHFLFEK